MSSATAAWQRPPELARSGLAGEEPLELLTVERLDTLQFAGGVDQHGLLCREEPRHAVMRPVENGPDLLVDRSGRGVAVVAVAASTAGDLEKHRRIRALRRPGRPGAPRSGPPARCG